MHRRSLLAFVPGGARHRLCASLFFHHHHHHLQQQQPQRWLATKPVRKTGISNNSNKKKRLQRPQQRRRQQRQNSREQRELEKQYMEELKNTIEEEPQMVSKRTENWIIGLNVAAMVFGISAACTYHVLMHDEAAEKARRFTAADRLEATKKKLEVE